MLLVSARNKVQINKQERMSNKERMMDMEDKTMTYRQLAEGLSGRDLLLHGHIMMGFHCGSPSPVSAHVGKVKNGELKGERAVILEPLPITHYTRPESKADRVRTANLVSAGEAWRGSRKAWADLPVVVLVATGKYVPVVALQALEIHGDVVGWETVPKGGDHEPVNDVTTYAMTDIIHTSNGLTFKYVTSFNLDDYVVAHMRVSKEDIESFPSRAVEVPAPFSFAK